MLTTLAGSDAPATETEGEDGPEKLKWWDGYTGQTRLEKQVALDYSRVCLLLRGEQEQEPEPEPEPEPESRLEMLRQSSAAERARRQVADKTLAAALATSDTTERELAQVQAQVREQTQQNGESK
eukprot:SAG31_NODE_6214_length_2118_cov_1.263992_1_plen_124_part_10